VQKEKKKLDNFCQICHSELVKSYPNAILIPCCKNSWFHKKCLQKYAQTAGQTLFKCPLCGNKCIEELKLMGIFFPNRDALWEFDESAFGDMYSPANIICESNNCAEPSMNSDKQYEFKLCFYCGSAGIHYNCFTGSNSDTFTCISCKAVTNQSICLDRSKRKSVQKDSPDIKQPPTKCNKKAKVSCCNFTWRVRLYK
jgi:G2/M phase-specific E3 ubiquitin-protein ligase